MANLSMDICEEAGTEEIMAERRLWTAVIVAAVQDWLSKSTRIQRAAHRFLFEDDSDFYRVCACAGLDPSSLRSKLLRVGRRPETHRSPHPVAA